MANKLLALILIFQPVFALAEISEFANPLASKQTVSSCKSFLASGACDKFKGQPGALQENQCQAEIDGANWSVLSRLSNCGSGFKMSAEGLWETAKLAGSNVGAAVGGVYNYLTDNESRAATHESLKDAWRSSADYLESVYPYLAMEFQKSYQELSKNGGDGNVNAMIAAHNMAPRLMAKLMTVVLEVIKAKYQDFHCFDNNKQVELTCKVAGDLLVPPTGIIAVMKYGAKGLAQVHKATKAIDEFFESGRSLKIATKTEEEVRRAKDFKEKNLDPQLRKLYEASQDLHSTVRHEIINENGENILKIKYLGREQKKFMGEALIATKAGKINKVNAGEVVGPKVLPAMLDFAKKVSKDAPNVKFVGRMDVKEIKGVFGYESKSGAARTIGDGIDNPKYWSAIEVQRYEKAFKEMKIDEACKAIYQDRSCRYLEFEFDSGNPNNIIWRKPQ